HAVDLAGRRERLEITVLVVLGPALEGAELPEGARVGEQRDALADGQLAAAPLPLDLVGAAHLLGQLLPPADLLDLRLPRHRHPPPPPVPLSGSHARPWIATTLAGWCSVSGAEPALPVGAANFRGGPGRAGANHHVRLLCASMVGRHCYCVKSEQ